jgi:hypothetical protein
VHRILTDRGVQAAAAAAVTIGVLALVFADRHAGAWIALGAAWVIVTAAAVTRAARRAD